MSKDQLSASAAEDASVSLMLSVAEAAESAVKRVPHESARVVSRILRLGKGVSCSTVVAREARWGGEQ